MPAEDLDPKSVKMNWVAPHEKAGWCLLPKRLLEHPAALLKAFENMLAEPPLDIDEDYMVFYVDGLAESMWVDPGSVSSAVEEILKDYDISHHLTSRILGPNAVEACKSMQEELRANAKAFLAEEHAAVDPDDIPF